jgi:DNA-binding PadR family transcriptional regulator
MALEILILSVLRTGPTHGYELKRRVQRPTLTKLSNNSLYPALRRFEASGAVTKTVEEQDGKPAKKVYSITDAGRQQLSELVSTLPPELAASDEEFLIRLGFFTEIDVEHRLGILAVRKAVIDGALEQVRTLIVESAQSPARRWRNLSMERLISRFEEESRWIADLAVMAAQDEERDATT